MKNLFFLFVSCIIVSCNNDEPTPIPFVPVTINPSLVGKGNLNGSEGVNQQTLVLETANFTSSIVMNFTKELTINTHSTLPCNKLFFAVREKATTKQYSFQLDFYFEEQ